jgi:methyl-accepting chemotaxis protein
MMRDWTFSRKLTAALTLMVLLSLIIGLAAIYSLRTVVASKDAVIDVNAANLELAERLFRLTQQQRAAVRDYILVTDPRFLSEVQTAQADADEVIRQLGDNGVIEIAQLRQADLSYRGLVSQLLMQRRNGGDVTASIAALGNLVAIRQQVEGEVQDLLQRQQQRLDERRQQSTDTAQGAVGGIVFGIALAVIAAVVAAFALSRTLTAQIGSAVQHVQSSAAELQAAANQQASGSKEQATAMAEITTTISELLATSRQIAESAQRVARVAEETAASARVGEQTVREGGDSVSGIKRQVDAIVTHMLELGRKSQEIGGILEIITELADQTNILAVNAAIEAAGAGDAGRRFGVVAEEIRRLADRVGGSAKEIRGLIQDVRGSVNASVMATETASKTVEAGASHFSNVSSSFGDIAVLVRTTNEAAREIELSTKQQSSAVEQVNRGVADVAQAAKETEVTSAQMLETVSQMAKLSTDLTRLVRSQRAA